MTEQDKVSVQPTRKGFFHAPWEKYFDKTFTPFEEFIYQQTTIVVLACVENVNGHA